MAKLNVAQMHAPDDNLMVAAGAQTSYHGNDAWLEWYPDAVSGGSFEGGRLERAREDRSQERSASTAIALPLRAATRRNGCRGRAIIWAEGVTAALLDRILTGRRHAETDRSGRAEVGPDLTISGYPQLNVIGTLHSTETGTGKSVPGFAQVAIHAGAYAARPSSREM